MIIFFLPSSLPHCSIQIFSQKFHVFPLRNKVPLDKLLFAQLAKNFPVLCKIQRFLPYAVLYDAQPFSFLRRSVAVVCCHTSFSAASLITLPTFCDSTSVSSTRSLLLPISPFQTYSSTPCMISGFRREVDKNCALLGYYAASSGNLLPTFQDNLMVPYPGVKMESCTLQTAVLFNELFLYCINLRFSFSIRNQIPHPLRRKYLLNTLNMCFQILKEQINFRNRISLTNRLCCLSM